MSWPSRPTHASGDESTENDQDIGMPNLTTTAQECRLTPSQCFLVEASGSDRPSRVRSAC